MDDTQGHFSKYRPEYARQARKLCLLGATDEQLGDFFGVVRNTILNWRNDHEDFREACRSGKAVADAEIADALYRRARGWSHKAVKIFADPKTGVVLQVPYREKYPPDSTAMIWWLKNRRPDMWRDRPVDDPDAANDAARALYEALEAIGRNAKGE